MIVTDWQHFANEIEDWKVTSCLLKIWFNFIDISDRAVILALFLLSLDVNAFDTAHCEEEIFDQEGLLNVEWERAKWFWFFLIFVIVRDILVKEDSRSICQIVMVQSWPLDEPIWQEGDLCLDQLESRLLIDCMTISRDQIGLLDIEEGTKRNSECYIIKGSHWSLVIGIIGINDGPLRKPRNVVIAALVVDVLLHLKFATCIES
jgi:hypothetical protein